MKNRPFHIRVRFACAGIAIVWTRERSFRTQLCCAAAAILAIVIFRPAPVWIALIALNAALVLALEMLNSALEYLIDHVHPGIAVEIGHAKDAAAGAVSIACISAAVVGMSMVASKF